jgi:hypothetical protein
MLMTLGAEHTVVSLCLRSLVLLPILMLDT